MKFIYRFFSNNFFSILLHLSNAQSKEGEKYRKQSEEMRKAGVGVGYA